MRGKLYIYIFLIIVVLITPVIVNILIGFGDVTTTNDWIGFFGSYTGGIIGAVVALWIVKVQVENSKEDIEKQIIFQKELNYLKEIINQRVFIDYTMDIGSIILDEVEAENKYILLHSHVSTIIHHNSNLHLKKMRAHFLKTRYFGGASCILDLMITIKLRNREDDNNVYTATMSMTGLNKNESIYVPLFLKEENMDLIFVKIEYRTLADEKIRFVSDLLKKKETYYTINQSNDPVLIRSKTLKDEYYINPGNPHSDN